MNTTTITSTNPHRSNRSNFKGMATASAMVRPPPPKGPPPSHARNNGRSIPPKGFRPPPPPPPPLTHQQQHAGLKRTNDENKFMSQSGDSNKIARKGTSNIGPRKEIDKAKIIIHKPKVLRDVTKFQKKHQVGQGTYGSVFMGADFETGEIVALKRINTEQEENGFPITAIREVKILKALSHKNIVKLKEIVTSKEQDEIPKNVFMVFEYLEYDLTGILETQKIRLTPDHVKSWAYQLLEGTHYMHINKIVHRDLKASNLLINRKGELKIADWGLARGWNTDMDRLTNRVVTLWYRPPELLLGCVKYSTKIDMWSVGCIITEMFRRNGFLKGTNEASQIELIFRTFGHPRKEDWPRIHNMCPLWKNFEPANLEEYYPSRLNEALRQRLPNALEIPSSAMVLIEKLLTYNPDLRWSAMDAIMNADYFFEKPAVKQASDLPMNLGVDSVHEWEARKRHEQRIKAAREAKALHQANKARTSE